MPNNINDIISPEAERQLRDLNDNLETAIQNITKFGQAAKGITVEFKGVKDFATLNELQQKVKDTTDKMAKSQRDLADAIDMAQVKEEKAVAKFVADAEKKAAIAEKAAERERRATAKLNNEYEQLKAAYAAASAEAQRLGAKLGTNDAQFKAAAASAKGMYDQLLKIELAVGKAQRQVGQYNQAAFAMQQLLRETPAFAYSFGTGIMAISNNIPILIDEIKRLKVANEELKASGAKTIPIWKTLLGSIFSPTGILTLGIGIFTILATKLDIFKSKTNEAADATKKFNDELKEIDKQAQKSAASEQSRVNVLVQTAKNTALAMDVRTNAVKELQNLYPAYLGNLAQEKILTGDITKELEDLNKAIVARSMATAIGDKITKEYEKIIAAEAELGTMRSKTMQGVGGGAPQAFIYDQQERTQALKEEIATAEEAIKQYNKLVDQYAAGAGALMAGKTKDAAVKKTKDTTLKAENELTQAIFTNRQKELEIIRDTNKSISEDTEKTMQERLAAYQNYIAAVLELAKNERDRTIEIENEKIDEINRLKKGKSGQELKNLIDMEYAAMVRIQTAQKEFNNTTQTTTHNSRKAILGIVNSSNDQWIKSEEFKNEKLKELQINLFLMDSELLKQQLQRKEISQREYDRKMKDLRKSEGAMILQDDIDLYTRLLQNKELSAEKQLEIQRKLNQALKAKSQMDAGSAPRSGRITDGLALSLGITDEKAMQAFYDSAINLANTAADTIVSIAQRQYDAEMRMLDRKREAIQTNYDLQMDLINATSKTDEERANRTAKLNSERMEQEAEIEEKRKQIAIKQAQFQKAASVAAIIQNTAVAITKAIAEFTVAAPPIVALIAAAGAAQLASVVSAPLPAYKEGTDHHKGGAFIAGDGGAPELIVAPNKRPYWSASTSTLYNEAAGTKVIPIDKFVRNIDATAGYSAGSVLAQQNGIMYTYLADLIGEKFDEVSERQAVAWAHIARANKPNIDMNAIAEQMRRERNLQGR